MRGGGARALAFALLRGAAVVFVVVLVSLVLLHLAPGDPMARVADDASVPDGMREQLRAQMGTDRPLPEQVVRWVAYAVRGDLGFSVSAGLPVRDALAHALPYTLLLGGIALVVGFALGIGIALAQVRTAGRRLDRWLAAGALAIWALPEFLIALVLIELFSLRLGWLPTSGVRDLMLDAGAGAGAQLIDRARHVALPALTLALVVAAQVARHQRVALQEAWGEPFVRAARSRGVREGALLLRHAWRAALAPTIALAGLALPTLASGAFVIEYVFAWPGMGRLAFQALADRDPHLALGCVVLTATLVVFGGTFMDIIHARVDPRRARAA